MFTVVPVEAADGRDVFVRRCVSMAATSMLLWDTICTFPYEVKYFWVPRKTTVSYLFFLYRYCSIVDNISILFADFGEHSIEICNIYNLYHQIFLIVLQIIVSILLSLRIIALYLGNWRVAALIVSVILAAVGATIWAMEAQHPGSPPDPSCWSVAAIQPVASWISLFVFDCFIFYLTLIRTWKMYRGRQTRPEVISVLVHDGTFYFGVMAIANLTNIFSFFFQQGIMRGMFSTPANNIAILLMSRLLFNLRRTMRKRVRGELSTISTNGRLNFRHRHRHQDQEITSTRPPLSTVVYAHATSLMQELALPTENESLSSRSSRGHFPSGPSTSVSSDVIDDDEGEEREEEVAIELESVG